MSFEVIGNKHFGGKVNVTDPCYNKDVWCRMDVDVADGMYDCIIHRMRGNRSRVGTIGIYKDGLIPRSKAMKVIGDIGVDAGLAGFFTNKPDYTDEQWDEICGIVTHGDAWITDDGFFSTSGYGDGCYAVYGYSDNGKITALEIRF